MGHLLSQKLFEEGLWDKDKGMLTQNWPFCIFFLSFVNCWMSGVGIGCRLYLLVDVCCWLVLRSTEDKCMLTDDCMMSLL
jgi:hypothetical protein